MPIFFATAADFRVWLARHAASESELVVGFYKVGSGQPSMTWPESVDEALCVGWIDGVRTRIDEHAYKIRFTPRKPTSTWSAKNIERVRCLEREGRMQEAGRLAHANRIEAKSRIYAYEQELSAALDPAEVTLFRRKRAAWKFFEAQPPHYRHKVVWGIISARRPQTRQRRLAKLIEASQKGERI